MEHYGIHGTELKWFTFYLRDRKQYTVVWAIKSQLGSISHGVPQGSCVGPLLILVYINDLPYSINHGISELYADDTGLSASGKKPYDVDKLINLDLDKIYSWLLANKLSINVEKTKYMIFATEYKLGQCPDLTVKVNGSKFKQVDRKDHLGLTLDEKLKWDKQVHAMCKKITSAVQALKSARFLPADVLKKLYNSLVESWLRYCCTVWGNCGKILKNQLQRMQHRTARMVCKTALETDNEVAPENLGRLNVHQLTEYNTALLIWKRKNGLASTYISDMFVPVKSAHNHDTRNAEFGFHPEKKNLTACTKRFSHTGCQIWNKLPRMPKLHPV